MHSFTYTALQEPPASPLPSLYPSSIGVMEDDPIRVTFHKYLKDIGQVYREQATTLIETCHQYAEASSQTYHDNSLQK